MKKILSICFLLSALFSCQAEITDPIDSSSQAPVGDSNFDEWDPSAVLVPGINLVTFTDGDRETTWPYYKSNATHKIKFHIVSGTSETEGSVDPGLYTVHLQYSANSGTTWTTITGAASLPSTVGAESTFNWNVVSSPALVDGTQYLIRATATNASNKSVTVQSSRTFTIDGTPPSINFLALSSGTLGVVSVGSPTDNLQAKVVNRSFFETTVAASDTTTVIKFVCVKAFDAIPPAADDSCWQDLEDGASKSLIKTDISTFVGFVQNSYKVSIWAMDFAGNTSSLTNGTGVESKDQITIAYNPAAAPTVTNVIASTNDSVSLSPSKVETTFVLNQDLFIRWKVTDTDLLTAPISLFYTLDEETFIPITGMQDITNTPVGCAINGDYTGCRRITAPTDKYFKIQIKVKDQSGLVSLSATPALNTDKFSIVAGNTDLGINGSANKAIFLSQVRAADVPGDFGTLAVSSKGKVYFQDATRGVLLVDPVDGVQKVFLAKGGKTGDGGPVSAATTVGNGKITVDYKDRLIVFDGDRIRRVEADGTINTIIGGGTVTTYTKAVAAKSLKFSTSMNMYTFLQVLPNGNIWFTVGNPTAQVYDYTIGIYKASEEKVYFMKLSGKGRYGDPEYTYTTDYVRTIALSFNYRTSQPEFLTSYICFPVPGGCGHYVANFNARNGVAAGYGTHAPNYAYWETQMFASRRGAVYWLGAHYPFKLGKYNVATNQWNNVVGGQTQGYCADGAVAVNCNISGIDAFVDGTNTVYFNDAGQIRVILPDGKLKTLFGERKSAGDGASPLAARMNGVNYMGVWGTSDTVVAADNKEFNVREITQGAAGAINRLAGNFTDDSVAFEAPAVNRYSTNAASAASFANEFWGGIQGVQVDPRDGTFYASLTRNGIVVKYEKDAATGKVGKWKLVLGAGGTAFLSAAADGVEGRNISMNGYPLVLHGILVPDGSTSATAAVEAGSSQAYLLAWTQRWNGACHVDQHAKIFSSASGTVRKFMGVATNPTCQGHPIFEENTDISNSSYMPNWGNQTTSSIYFKEERAVLMANLGYAKIIKAALTRNGSDQIVGAGMSSVFTTTTKGIRSFTYKKNTSNQYEVYYCATDGTLNKKNLTTGVETALPLPTSSTGKKFFTCDGLAITWDYNKNQVYFPFRQNGLSGVGKYCVTTTGICP